jgi:tyrosine 3-monooxygenase
MPKHACAEYRRVFKLLQDEGIFRSDRIPQLEEMSAFMKSKYRLAPQYSGVHTE